MKTKQSSSSLSYKRRAVLAVQASIALGLAVWLAVRAIDTGSLQQYGLALLFLAISIFKAAMALRGRKEEA